MAVLSLTYIFLILSLVFVYQLNSEGNFITTKEINDEAQVRVERIHKEDSLNLLIYLFLLILTVVTIWVFKHHRLRFVHETGLSLIYGLITGVIVRYGTNASSDEKTEVVIAPNSTVSSNNPPRAIYLQACFKEKLNCTIEDLQYYYQYVFSDIFNKHFHKTWSPEGNAEELEKAIFNPEIFFNILLPPIIFYAGYSMKRRHFFRNFGALLTYAFVGTMISCFVVGIIIYGICKAEGNELSKFGFADSLFFGALISATDPVTVLAIFGELHVDVDLYALIFGESVLNDAVAIVMTGTVEEYNKSSTSDHGIALLKAVGTFLQTFLGAFLIGASMGCITALLTKFTYIRDHPLLETALFFLMSYSTFLAAEAAGLTGIVAVLFCGICQAHYTYNNLSPESRFRTRQLFQLLNLLAENFVFVYIGVSIFTYRFHVWNAAFIAGSYCAIIVARACNIYLLSFLLNLGRSNKIAYNMQHMMFFSGLRGAIAFALAIRNTKTESRKLIFSTTLLIVTSTIWIGGAVTTPMLSWLKIKVGVDDEKQNFRSPHENLPNNSNVKHRQYQSMENQDNGIVGEQSISVSSASGALPANNDSNANISSNMNNPAIHEAILESVENQTMSRIANSPKKFGKAYLFLKWYKIDTNFIKPLLTNSRPTLLDTLPKNSCCQGIARLFTTDEQLAKPVIVHPIEGNHEVDTDLILEGDTDFSFERQPSSDNYLDGGGEQPSDVTVITSPTSHNHQAATIVQQPDGKYILNPSTVLSTVKDGGHSSDDVAMLSGDLGEGSTSVPTVASRPV